MFLQLNLARLHHFNHRRTQGGHNDIRYHMPRNITSYIS